MIERKNLDFYNDYFVVNQKDTHARRRIIDRLSEKEIEILQKNLTNACINARRDAHNNPTLLRYADNVRQAFIILLSAEQHPQNLNPMRSFFAGTLGKQVIDCLSYNKDKAKEIATALKELWRNNTLNIVTMYLFSEMIRNQVPEKRAVQIILEFSKLSRNEKWKPGKWEEHMPWLQEYINAYLQNPEAFTQKVQNAIQKDRKRDELHRVAMDKTNYHGYANLNYNYARWREVEYSRPLWSADFQDIDGKTPLHYAIERADKNGLNIANILLANKLGYSTASTKDDAGKTPRDLVNEIKDEKMKAQFTELFEVADQRQRLQLAGEQIYRHLGHNSEKSQDIKKIMEQIRNTTTMKDLNYYQEQLTKACAQRRTFNFSIFEKFREVPKSLQILNRALEDKPLTLLREETDSKKSPSKGNH